MSKLEDTGKIPKTKRAKTHHDVNDGDNTVEHLAASLEDDASQQQAPVVYDAFKSSGKSASKRKLPHVEETQTEDIGEVQPSDEPENSEQGDSDNGSESSHDDNADDDGDDDGLLKVSKPKVSVVDSSAIPADELENISNPNNALRWFSIVHGLNVHYTQLSASRHLRLKYSAPGAGYTIPFVTVTCTKSQKWDHSGGTNFKRIPFESFLCIGAFGVQHFPRAYKYGNRDFDPRAKFNPASVAGIQMKFALSNVDFASSQREEKEDFGMVDADAEQFISRWFSDFDRWARPAAWKLARQAFENLLKSVTTDVETQCKEKMINYTHDLEEYNRKKKGPKPVKPNITDIIKTKMIQVEFMKGIKSSIYSTPKADVVYFGCSLLRTLSTKENSKNCGYIGPANDKWFLGQFNKPPPYKNANGQMQPGKPRIMVDVPMYRCVTRAEAASLKQQGRTNISPLVLIPWEDRFVEHNDVTAPIFGIERYDSPSGWGFRNVIKGIIWLGERNGLNESAQPLEGVDPTTYVLIAQQYARTNLTFQPRTVENTKVESFTDAAAAAATVSTSNLTADDEEAYQAVFGDV